MNVFLRHQILFVAGVAVVFGTAVVLTQGQPFSYWLEFWWMFPIALAISLIVNVAGISSAALFVPFFILLFPLFSGINLSTLDAVRIGLVTESFGLSSSALAFLAFGLVDMKIALRTILWALPFVVAGAFFTFAVPESILFIIIAIMLLSATLLIYFKKHLQKRRLHEHKRNHVRLTNNKDGEHVEKTSIDGRKYSYRVTSSGKKKRVFGYTVGGFFQGAAGFGIGELGIISMVLTHIPIRIAIGTSHIIIATTAVVASVIHLSFAPVSISQYLFPWNILIITVPAVIIGGQLAPFVAAKIPSKNLEYLIGILFIFISIALIFLSVAG